MRVGPRGVPSPNMEANNRNPQTYIVHLSPLERMSKKIISYINITIFVNLRFNLFCMTLLLLKLPKVRKNDYHMIEHTILSFNQAHMTGNLNKHSAY